MKRKNLLLSLIVLSSMTFFISCGGEAVEVLPGVWDTEDGGTVTFGSDGTGSTDGSDFFTTDCGTLNGVQLGPYTEFTWTLSDSDGDETLNLEYISNDCTVSASWPIKVKSKKKIKVGVNAIVADLSMEITKR
jgi:hypothetical protein